MLIEKVGDRDSTPSNHWKYTLTVKNTKIANDLRVWHLIYLPVSDYEPKQMKPFGEPEEKLKARVVRVRMMTDRLLLSPQQDNKIKVTYDVNTDSGAKIPRWMVNDMISDFPFYSLQSLRELVKKEQLKIGLTH